MAWPSPRAVDAVSEVVSGKVCYPERAVTHQRPRPIIPQLPHFAERGRKINYPLDIADSA